ncbi:MAG: MerR family transcriptional regulator [Proteobacteria bacterium]|nr:MAG: MerR family transcriptional regulator [Pseudomonadota bacterium]
MERGFSQITFDFNSPENTVQTTIPQAAKPEKKVELKPPLQIESVEPVVTFTPVPKTSGRGRKSQKLYAAEADLVNIPEDEILFQKQYYTIGEVSQMFKVNASLLRFWESEFDIIKPRKNRKGDRHFRPVDIKNLQLIYDLLRRRKLTIDGARDFIKNNKKSQERFVMIQSLQKIKGFLLEIKSSL